MTDDEARTLKAGEAVEIAYGGKWFKARVLYLSLVNEDATGAVTVHCRRVEGLSAVGRAKALRRRAEGVRRC